MLNTQKKNDCMWTFTGFIEKEPQYIYIYIYICALSSTSTTEKVYFYNVDNKILCIYGFVS